MTSMGIFNSLFGRREVEWRAALRHIQRKFSVFRSLVEQQNQVLKAISGLEEGLRQNLRPDRRALDETQQGIAALIEKMIELGGDDYSALRQRYRAICEALQNHLEEKGDFSAKLGDVSEDLAIPFDRIGRGDAGAVGNKNANLGELKSQLGLPVPDGFAISTRACRYFATVNQLAERIDALLQQATTGDSPPGLASLSAAITSLIVSCPVPDELKAAIQRNYDDLTRRCPARRFAMRSSATDEDTAFTFAGQYLSLLNVRKEELLDSYKRVLASQFTPAALGRLPGRQAAGKKGTQAPFVRSTRRAVPAKWCLPFSTDLAMAVGCMAFIDAAASGVIYTRDPLNADSDHMLVNAVLGLGSYLVEGILTPDEFHVSRRDGTVLFSRLARKPVQLGVLADGGVAERAVPEPEQENASIDASACTC